jgi:hydroxymethylpyrimidine/phosphomethylpyrimidine kinase
MSQQSPSQKSLPVVLAVGGHDPSGGAGIQADIETIAALGCHAATAVTTLTVQDTVNVIALHPVDSWILRAQLNSVFDDMAVAVVKVGLLGGVAAANTLADVLEARSDLPVVLDPVLAAGGGAELSSDALREVIRMRLLPRTFLVTPNTVEAQRLTGASAPEAAAMALMELGARHVLLSGGHEPGDEVVNRYFGPDGARDEWRWPRLAGEFHGSGCTLASACAALLARGLPIGMALRLAQAFTHDALAQADRPGRGQAVPRRVLAPERKA